MDFRNDSSLSQMGTPPPSTRLFQHSRPTSGTNHRCAAPKAITPIDAPSTFQGKGIRIAAMMPSATGIAAAIATQGTDTFLPHESHGTGWSGDNTHLRTNDIAGCLQ